MSRSTVAQVCSVVRIFLRFLHATGRIAHDLAFAVLSPRVRASERPPRALPWDDVRAIIRAIDRRSAKGRRDYALLLTMAVYGLGAREILGIRLEDVDWVERRLHIRRSKTGREIVLPLLPSISRALVSYLRYGRPPAATSRALFVQMLSPFEGIRRAGSIQKIMKASAAAAGLLGLDLGSHVLRHSHATRQTDLGASQKVIGDILGHVKPSTTSMYVRVAIHRLSQLSLPVPR